MLILCDDVGLVPGYLTDKYLVRLLWDELAVTHALCFTMGASWYDVWSDIQVLVGVFQ